MKKLLVLPALGAAAALTWGAAAALNVSGNHAAIQVGTVNQVWCAEGARIAGWGYEQDNQLVSFVRVEITDPNGDCDGAQLFVSVHDAPGAKLVQGSATLGNATNTYKINFPSPVSAASIEKVVLGIEG